MPTRVIMLSGFKNSGKDTTAKILAKFLINNDDYDVKSIEYQSFALPIKAAASKIFGIPFEVLEGKTPENRELREQVDPFWSQVIPEFTPRKSLTMLGTDILRKYIHNDLWVLRMQQSILSSNSDTIIITDLREPNEKDKIEAFCRENDIKVCHVHINRINPDWYEDGMNIILEENPENWESEFEKLNVHPSEWKQLLLIPDFSIDNTEPDYESHIEKQLWDYNF